MAQLQPPGADSIFLIDAAAQLKSSCWPCGPTVQLARVLSAWTLISIRFISPLLPCFFKIALTLCSLGQSYIHWSRCSGILTLPGASCVPMMQMSLNLSPESDPGVSQKPVRIKSLWTRRGWLDPLLLPVSPSSPGREAASLLLWDLLQTDRGQQDSQKVHQVKPSRNKKSPHSQGDL